MLDIYRAAVLKSASAEPLEVKDDIYLVCLVIVLRVVFEDLRLLLVFKGADQVIGPELLAPLFVLDEPSMYQLRPSVSQIQWNSHLLAQLDVEFACSQKAQQ